MANDAIIRYDGSKPPCPPPPVPPPKIAAEKLRELLLDIVEEHLASIMVTTIDSSATDHEIPTARATWFLWQITKQAAAEAGYMYFYIDRNGDLIMDKSNVHVNFYLDDGDLYVEAIE